MWEPCKELDLDLWYYNTVLLEISPGRSLKILGAYSKYNRLTEALLLKEQLQFYFKLTKKNSASTQTHNDRGEWKRLIGKESAL